MKFCYTDPCEAEGLPEASDEELALMTKIMDKMTVDLDLTELGVPIAGVAKTRYKNPFKDRVYACVLLLIFLSCHVSILMFSQ